MKKVFSKVTSFCLAIAMCLGITAAVGVSPTQSVVADAATDYYASVTAQGGTQLLGQLHDLITDSRTKYTSYADCKTYGKTTDPGSGSNTVMEFYTHIDISNSKWDVSGGWNREHVWAKSLSGGLWETSGGGSDLHHIRPAEKDLNNHRSSKKYGEVGSGGKEEYTSVSNVLGGHSNSNTFEPLDNAKGDVARIVMYVYTHYNSYSYVGGTTNGSGGSGFFGQLKFTQIITASSEDAAKKLLLEWNNLDPVDEIERVRNEEVYKIQGNRNPFIDNSSYADAIWGDGSVDPNPPVNPDVELESITLDKTSLNLSAGQTEKLTVKPNPSNAKASVNWTTSNPAVATVSSNGDVTAISAGTATIIATSKTDSSIWASAQVTVTKSNVNKATINLDSFTLTHEYGFKSWSAGGINGTAYIFGGNDNYQPTGMQFSPKKSSYYVASTSATPQPIRKVTVKTVSGKFASDWKLLTSDSQYGEVAGKPATGNDNGTKSVTDAGVSWTLTGSDTYFALTYEFAEGTTYTAYLDSIEVEYEAGDDTPVPPAELESITINPASLSIKVGGTRLLTVTPSPINAEFAVNWTSSDTSVATVSANGTVIAVKEGTATITVTSKSNPSITATATVTITKEVVKPDDSNVKAFENAVTAIPSSGSLEVRFTAINKAIGLYNKLTAAEKAAVATSFEALNSAIASYNELINSYNSSSENSDEIALGGSGSLLKGGSGR